MCGICCRDRAAAPAESEMIDSEYALFRLLIAEAWSRLCLGADAP